MWGSFSSTSKRTGDGRKPLPTGRNAKLPGTSRFTAIMQGSTPLDLPTIHKPTQEPLIGSLPTSAYAQILSYLPVYDIPAVARTCRRLARVVRCDDAVWKRRCALLSLKVGVESVQLDDEHVLPSSPRASISSHPANTSIPTLPKPNRAQDDLGDFGKFVIDDGDDGFGDFEQAKGKPVKTIPAPSAQTSLLDLDFDLADVPLPSKMVNGKGGPKPSGFFGLVVPARTVSSSHTTDRNNRQSLSSSRPSISAPTPTSAYYTAYKEHHMSLWEYVRTLRSTSPSESNGNVSVSPSQLLSLLFPPTPSGSPNLSAQAHVLVQILQFLSKANQPSRDWGWLRQILGGCCDRFDAICLNTFDKAESRLVANSTNVRSKNLENGTKAVTGQVERGLMREAAESSWILHLAREEDRENEERSRSRSQKWSSRSDGAISARQDTWELGRVWVEKKEVFYEGSKWDPSENVVRVTGPEAESGSHRLDFNPMDAFMGHILAAIMSDGQDAMEVFPAETGRSVMLAYIDRLAADVLAEYINPLLHQTKLLSQKLFLTATAATFVQAWRVVDAICNVLTEGGGDADRASLVTSRATVGAVIFDMFEVNMDDYLDEEVEWLKMALGNICTTWDGTLAGKGDKSAGSAFLASSNPALVKKNVLAGFRDVLLLPVTIVPLTVNYGVNAIAAGGNQVVNGLSMLNPQKWTNAGSAVKTGARADLEAGAKSGATEKSDDTWTPPPDLDQVPSGLMAPSDSEKASDGSGFSEGNSSAIIANPTDAAARSREESKDAFDQLQLLLSLDVVLELIQVDRESLKRVETFRDYPGQRGKAVRNTIEEVFILLLQALGNRHIAPGFKVAIAQMGTYEPGQDEGTTSVAPLVQFFELVHIGDTIQSIVQTYFDKDLTAYVDRSDFLNGAVQEKKRFEGTLDDSVAGGLNAGIEVLMNQVDHIIRTRTPAGAYCPPDTAEMELGPTQGCQDAIKCLQQHCELLKGSTSKDVLEVFYQEVGIRLQAILQRHIKRQIISQVGGFQVISDLNAYHQFITTLKQQRLTEDFSNLKMLGHVYVVADAKDLASIVRDVTRYGGTFTPEDLYEFIQRRSDWRKISKTVDQAMYALSVTEDCVIM